MAENKVCPNQIGGSGYVTIDKNDGQWTKKPAASEYVPAGHGTQADKDLAPAKVGEHRNDGRNCSL